MTKETMRHFIENHFGFVMFLSCIAGLALPGLDGLPNWSAVGVLAVLMFISCYRLRDSSSRDIRWRDIGVFYVLRYVLLPIGLWAVAGAVAPAYATSVFLLSVVPAGVASAAFSGIYGGSIAPAFAIVIVSQLAAPILIPLQFAWAGGVTVGPSPVALFITMLWCIFLPMLVYAALRKHRRSAAYIYARNKLYSVLLVAFIIALAIAKQRAVILSSGLAVVTPLVITILCFICYIAFGWCAALHRPRAERITFATCSSYNNAALGVSLALLHFPPDVVLFVAVSEIAWSMLPLMMRLWLRVFSSPADGGPARVS